MSYTVKQAAELLGIHQSTVIDRIKRGFLKARKIPIPHAFTYEIEEESLMENLSNQARRNKRYVANQGANPLKSME